MSYQALFRKYRSQSFDDLVGQDHVVQTLRHSIERKKIAQVYLFTGPRGTGKTSTARLLAKALNCTGGPSVEIPPDCPICAEITAGSCLDVVEMDAASESGVEKVREHIVEASEYQPSQCRYRVFIIDEVHDLSAKAFDALLKTIEEPPAHVIFILATTEFHKVPPTIRSRCQKFEFHRGTIAQLVARLNHVIEKEGISAEPAAVTAIARLSDGGYRDALTFLEQAVVTMGETLTLDHVYQQLGLISDEVTDELLQAISRGDLAAIITCLDTIYQRGRDPQAILESLMHRLADMTRAVLASGVGSQDQAADAGLTSIANRIGQENILSIRGQIAQRHKAVKEVTLPRIWLEAELIKISLDLRAPVMAARAARNSLPSAVVNETTRTENTIASTNSIGYSQTETPPVTSVQVSGELPKSNSDIKNVPQQVQGDVLTDINLIWQKVQHEITSLSRSAAVHLSGSAAIEQNGNVVTINLEKLMNVDWVKGKPPLVKAIRDNWKKFSGNDVDFEFVSLAKREKSSPTVEGVSVESPLEGVRLAEAAKRIFGTANE